MKNFTFKTVFACLLLIPFLTFAQGKKDKKAQNIERTGIELTDANQEYYDNTGIMHCLTDENEKILQEKYPRRKSQEDFEAWLAPKVEEARRNRLAGRRVVVTIPVVVHVIHNGEAVGTGPNISDTQVISQIDVLNEDFRKMMGTLGDGTGVDTEIEFCLATEDPDGCATNGIVRFDGSTLGVTGWSGPGGNTDTVLKPATIWDPTQYMNMWSVNFASSSLLGYAQFPETSTTGLAGLPGSETANSDGVVAGYTFFGDASKDDGTFNVTTSAFNRGRTMTHEVGHYLGLRHIWGDASCGNDFCNDTPTQQSPSSGNCPNSTTCDGVADLTTNYMDYSNDACMNNFTQNQKDRMVAVLAHSPRRVELTTSTKCNLAATGYDGSIKVNNLNLTDCELTYTPELELTNYGTITLTSITIQYSVDSGASSTINWTGSLATGASEIVTLPVQTSAPGAHTFNASISNPNGNTDARTCNDDDMFAFSIQESFATATSITVNITPDNYGSEITWTLNDSGGTTIASGGPYTDGVTTLETQTVGVVVDECYSFTINDSYGDGICCGFGTGNYELVTNEGTVIATGGEYGASETVSISTKALSTDEFAFTDNTITLYPNPTRGNITIKLSVNDLPDSYDIYNVVGQRIMNGNISNLSDLEINTNSLSNGMYFVKIQKEGQFVTLPFIKE